MNIFRVFIGMNNEYRVELQKQSNNENKNETKKSKKKQLIKIYTKRMYAENSKYLVYGKET